MTSARTVSNRCVAASTALLTGWTNGGNASRFILANVNAVSCSLDPRWATYVQSKRQISLVHTLPYTTTLQAYRPEASYIRN